MNNTELALPRTAGSASVTYGTVKTSGPSGVTAIVCSKCAEELPVGRDHAPAVIEQHRLDPAGVDHGLDGEHIARLERGAPVARPVVGHLRLLVHGGADGVPDVLAHDAEAGRLGHVLDGAADLVQRVALGQLRDARPQAALGHLDQLLRLLGDAADAHGERGVAVVALDDRPAVDGEDVALLEHVGAGDAVDDH